MRVDDNILSTVVFLGLNTDAGFVPLGTGFLVAKSTGGRLFQHIVTARHVVEMAGVQDVTVRINTTEAGAELILLRNGLWVFHPDEAVDVAVHPTHAPTEHYEATHVSLDDGTLTGAVIEELRIGVGDDVFTVGMFTRHMGDFRNRPIVRTGTVAAMPLEMVETNRGRVSAYLIEARSISGLSGSPVFLQVAPFRILPGGEVAQAEGPTHYLLGLIQGHHVTADALDVASPDDDYNPGDMNTGIGVVIPAEKILEVVDLPVLREQREALAR